MSDSDLPPKPGGVIARMRVRPKTHGGGWCYDCGHYRLTESEARAVACKLAQLDRFERELRQLTAAHADTLNRFLDIDKRAGAVARELARLDEKQPCGHERRFVVTGDDKDIDPHSKSDRGKTGWCALCDLESVKAHLRQHHAEEERVLREIFVEEATDEEV